MMWSIKIVFLFSSWLATTTHGFSTGTGTLFQEQVAQQVTAPAVQPGVEIELPDFEKLFERVQQVSPMAGLALQNKRGEVNGKRGFEALKATSVSDELTWRMLDNNPKRLVHQIQKIENFQGLSAPLLRFRCQLNGPCIAHLFAKFLTNTEFRAKWDASIANVYEKYPIADLDAVNIAMGFGRYGECSKIGVGYCTTKPSFGVDSREQLTMCGIQDFDDGSSIIWGTEMEPWHDDLLPADEERRTRARSHLFATTLVPTGKDTFDVEYVLQLDIGGSIPNWLTTPIVIDNVKNMFKVVNGYFGDVGKGGPLDKYLIELQQEALQNDNTLLMTP